MKAHWQYLKYVLRHKWFVFQHCRTLGVPLWRAVIHDWSKFTPAEWAPYVHSFYNPDGSKRDVRDESGAYDPTKISREFDRAWLHHLHHNPHHWQHWVLINDEDGTVALEIPETYVYEMVADWAGAGQAITGRVDPCNWYIKNGEKMTLHQQTRELLESLLLRYY